jgi:TolB-like protein/Tfp pilus assembly protein PilF
MGELDPTERRWWPPALLAELRRRGVLRALAAYGVFTFAVLQVVEPVMHGLHLPEWILTLVVILLALGFPAAVAAAWVFDLEPGGLVRTDGPVAPGAGRGRLAAVAAVAAAVSLAGLAAWWWARPAASGLPGPAGGAPAASIAVLPFDDLSPGKDYGWFADGLADEILSRLAQVDGLKVSGRTSSFSFKGKGADVKAIGAALGVGAVLEGSVRRASGRLRVTAQLIRVEDGFHVWARTFERDAADVFAVEDELAAGVVDALRLKLLPGHGVERRGGTASREAFERYLVGRERERTLTPEAMQAALAAYREAVAIDPGYAQAWAGVSRVLWFEESVVGPPTGTPEGRRAIVDAADRAVALAPELAAGWAARALGRMYQFHDLEGARADLERAFAVGGSDALAHTVHGELLALFGRQAESISAHERAAAIEPLDAFVLDNLGRAHLVAGDHARARAVWRRSLEVAPESPLSRYYLCAALLVEGKATEALHVLDGTEPDAFRLTCQAMALADLGRQVEAEGALAAVARYGDAAAYQVGQVNAWWGRTDAAFGAFERVLDGGDAGIYWIRTDPLLAKVRGDPRWAEMLRRLKVPVP